MKRLLAVLLAFVMILSLSPMTTIAATDVVAGGTCGDDLTWTLDSDGLLTISGSGDMEKYSNATKTPWYTYKDQIRSVVIDSGATYISQYAFGGSSATYAYSNLTSVSIPNTVTDIGASAFRYANMEEVTIPASVTTFGTYIFANNDSLKTVNIEGITTGNYTFANCPALTTINFSGNTIGNGAFQKCTALETIAIENATIGSSAFNGCTSLHTATIDSSTIGASAFAGCTALNYVYLSKNVTTINNSAFNNCTGLLLACYAGNESEWEQVTVGTNNTSLTNYLLYNMNGQDPSAKPVVTQQPVGATWDYKAEADDLTVGLTNVEGADLYYAWFYNTKNSTQGGTLFTREETCQPDTTSANIVGTRYYYAVITMVSNGLVSNVTTEPVAITVQWNELTGAGTKENPYQLTCAADLEKLSKYVNEGNECDGLYFHIAADITLPADWEPIGAPKTYVNDEGETVRYAYTPAISYKNMNLFRGNIDGLKDAETGECYTITIPEDEKTMVGALVGGSITNLNIYGKKIDGYGVVEYYFNMTASNSHNILIENVTLKSGSHTKYSGFIGGYASGVNTVTIRNCTVEEGVIVGDDGTYPEWAEELQGMYSYVYGPDKLNHDKNVTGGNYLVQYNDMIGSFAGAFNGTIENCVSYAKVYGRDFVGGIGGFKGQAMGDCIIRNCRFYGEVYSTGDFSGGILGSGYMASSAPNTPCVTIENCAVLGDVYGTNYVGGIFGGNYTTKQCWNNGIGYIRGNYVSGSVSGENYVGGIIGYINAIDRYNVINNNYYLEGIADKGIAYIGSVETALAQYKRLDDPTGADADKLAATFKESDLSDGTLMNLLNASGAGKVWYMNDGKLIVTDSKHVVRLVNTTLNSMTPGTMQQSLGLAQFESYPITVTYSDGTTETVKATDCRIHIDMTESSYVLATLTYGDYSLYFGMKITADGANDATNAQDVEIIINLIGDVTLGSEEAILTARNAYDALSDDAKAQVTNYAVLTAAEAKLEQLKKDAANQALAQPVIEQIDEIGTVTLYSANAIANARTAYDRLSDAAKAFVSNYATLTAAEAELQRLKAENTAVPVEIYITIADKGNVVVKQQKITVTDVNDNGFFDVDDALCIAHEQYYADGVESGYGSYTGYWGLSISKLWGDTSGNYGYWVNNASCWSLEDLVSSGDHLVAFVYQDGTTWSDAYAAFGAYNYDAQEGTAFSVKLDSVSYAPDYSVIWNGHSGATITVYDAQNNIVTATCVDNGDGTYTLTLPAAGTYYLVATDSDPLIVPAVTVLTVNAKEEIPTTVPGDSGNSTETPADDDASPDGGDHTGFIVPVMLLILSVTVLVAAPIIAKKKELF